MSSLYPPILNSGLILSISEQFQGSFKALLEQFQSFRALSEQFQSSRAVSEQF